MAIASIVADVFLMYIHKFRTAYRQGKFDVCDIDEKDSTILVRP
jgi:hypothetical protein